MAGMGQHAAELELRRRIDRTRDLDDGSVGRRKSAAVLAAIDLDQEREAHAVFLREARGLPHHRERVGHQNEIAAGGLPNAHGMGELGRNDSGGADNVGIAVTGKILGLLERRDRDAATSCRPHETPRRPTWRS